MNPECFHTGHVLLPYPVRTSPTGTSPGVTRAVHKGGGVTVVLYLTEIKPRDSVLSWIRKFKVCGPWCGRVDLTDEFMKP